MNAVVFGIVGGFEFPENGVSYSRPYSIFFRARPSRSIRADGISASQNAAIRHIRDGEDPVQHSGRILKSAQFPDRP
jgi:hypothetical protein